MSIVTGTAYRKIQRNLEDYGWAFTLRRILTRLATPFYEKSVYRIYCIRLSATTIRRAPSSDSFRLDVVQEIDEPLIQQIEQQAEWLQGDVARMIRGGALCVAALRKDQLAGFNLVRSGEVQIPLIHLRRKFRPNEAWSEFIGIRKPFRKQGLAAQLRHRVLEELRQRGVRKLYGGAEARNVASLRLADKVGFRPLADVKYRRILLWRSRSFQRVRK